MTPSDKTLLDAAHSCATGGGCINKCPYAGTTRCTDRLVTALANRLAEVLAEKEAQG